MPGAAVPRGHSCMTSWICPCFGTSLRPRILSGRSSMLLRHSTAAGRSRMDAHTMDPAELGISDLHAHRLLGHERSSTEVDEIATTLDVMLQACRAQSPPDAAMVRKEGIGGSAARGWWTVSAACDGACVQMRYVREAGNFLVGDSEESPILGVVRKANAFLTRNFGGAALAITSGTHSKAIEDIVRSGVSLSHSTFSDPDLAQPKRQSLQEMAAHSPSRRSRRILPF